MQNQQATPMTTPQPVSILLSRRMRILRLHFWACLKRSHLHSHGRHGVPQPRMDRAVDSIHFALQGRSCVIEREVDTRQSMKMLEMLRKDRAVPGRNGG